MDPPGSPSEKFSKRTLEKIVGTRLQKIFPTILDGCHLNIIYSFSIGNSLPDIFNDYSYPEGNIRLFLRTGCRVKRDRVVSFVWNHFTNNGLLKNITPETL
jgi:hypothetical protein